MNEPANAANARVAQVRERLKSYLRDNTEFLALPPEKQLSLYSEALERGLENLSHRARAMANDLNPTRFEDVAERAGEFLDQVEFSSFVKDLITGTYGSIVSSSIEQIEAYTRMFKELAKPLGAVAREISDADALDQIAADDPLRFTMGDDGITDNDSGMKLDTSNDEVQRLMFQAKLKLAKERRLLLRESMLMGVQRLVVDKGTIRAGLLFNIRANEAFQGKNKNTDITQTGKQGGGSFFGLFGGGSTKKQTKITVSSRELQTTASLNAQITGHVEVQFSSDYFKLDNFADLFGDESTRVFLAQKNGEAPGGSRAPQNTNAAPAATPR